MISACVASQTCRKSRAARRLTIALALALAGSATGQGARGATAASAPLHAGMVATSQHLASDVGAAILRRGGNAVDAAVAVGYALAVTHPCCGNLGGGGFMLIHLANGRDEFIDFRERAPLAARADMFLDAAGRPVAARSLDGYLAVGTPGTVMGLETARAKYGSMSRAALMAPAIALARDGFILDGGDVEVLADGTAAFRAQPNVAAIFLKDGRPLKIGDRLTQTDLAATLTAISAGGPEAFYRGPIAEAVADASRAAGGLISKRDFEAYAAEETTPVTCRYRGYTIVSAPPPSSGGVVLCEMLRVLAGYDLRALGYRSAAATHVMTEAMRHAYLDRNTYLGDPDFVKNPVAALLSDAHAASVRTQIRPDRATASASLHAAAAASENANTTHYSVVDGAGNAVAVTYTINDSFGAKVIAGDTGFLLNDEMDDFTAKPGYANVFGLVQGAANAVAPGKRPLSSMTPTLVLKDGRPVLVVGAPGGARIITTVLEVISNVIDYGMPLQQAVDAPRFHHQWLPDTLAAEPGALSAGVKRRLTAMGYKVVPLEPWGSGNAAEVIAVAPANAAAAKALGFDRPGRLYGANDSRSPAGSVAIP